MLDVRSSLFVSWTLKLRFFGSLSNSHSIVILGHGMISTGSPILEQLTSLGTDRTEIIDFRLFSFGSLVESIDTRSLLASFKIFRLSMISMTAYLSVTSIISFMRLFILLTALLYFFTILETSVGWSLF